MPCSACHWKWWLNWPIFFLWDLYLANGVPTVLLEMTWPWLKSVVLLSIVQWPDVVAYKKHALSVVATLAVLQVTHSISFVVTSSTAKLIGEINSIAGWHSLAAVHCAHTGTIEAVGEILHGLLRYRTSMLNTLKLCCWQTTYKEIEYALSL